MTGSTSTFHQHLRVLVVMPLGEALGGGEEMLRQLLREGRGRDVEWTVVFMRAGPFIDEVRKLGVDCHLAESGRFRDILKRWRAIRRIAAIARATSADVCLGWMVAGQAMAGPAGVLARIPVAWYQVATPRPDWLDRLANLWPAIGVLTLSSAGARAQAAMWPRRPVRLVYPGVPLGECDRVRMVSPMELRTKFGLPREGCVVGIVSRLQRWKGIHHFLEAFAAQHRRDPTTHAVVVGGAHETEPGYPEELRAQAGRLGIASAVTFAGFQPNALEWMQAMDIVVHASDREPFGIVVIEAMALGKPVVAGDTGGPAEVITTGVNGLLVPFGDAAALAAAIGTFITQPDRAAATGNAARRRAQTFSAEAYAANVVRALRDLLVNGR